MHMHYLNQCMEHILLNMQLFNDTAHMWFENTICNANTNEDIYNPEKTRRVSVICENNIASVHLLLRSYSLSEQL